MRDHVTQPSRTGAQAGFSLIETVFAIGIILVGVTAIITLGIASLLLGQTTSNQFVAAGLAQEAVETVRQVRDSNWLAYDADSTTAWNTGLSNGTDYSAIVSNLTSGAALRFTPNSFGHTCTGASGQPYDCTNVWFNTSTGQYFQTQSSTFNPANPAFQETFFRRLVFLYPICRSTVDETDEQVITSGTCAALGSYEQVGVDVVAQVEYPQRQTRATFTVEEYLYDWKY
jgi:Tfp pilus assembly protein PilV